jgi:hypothetical protein
MSTRAMMLLVSVLAVASNSGEGPPTPRPPSRDVQRPPAQLKPIIRQEMVEHGAHLSDLATSVALLNYSSIESSAMELWQTSPSLLQL